MKVVPTASLDAWDYAVLSKGSSSYFETKGDVGAVAEFYIRAHSLKAGADFVVFEAATENDYYIRVTARGFDISSTNPNEGE